jgi:hypothetical protein
MLSAARKRLFSYSTYEINRLELKLGKRINIEKMFVENRAWNYDPPTMTYDRVSGDVTISRPPKPKRAIIRTVVDYEREKEKLMQEVGFDPKERDNIDFEGDEKKFDDWDQQEYDKKKKEFAEKFDHKFRFKIEKESEDKEFYTFSRDFMRVDIGLIIQRPPIFAHTRERDMKYMKHRQDIMNEYFMDMKKYDKDWQEVSSLNADFLDKNPYVTD